MSRPSDFSSSPVNSLKLLARCDPDTQPTMQPPKIGLLVAEQMLKTLIANQTQHLQRRGDGNGDSDAKEHVRCQRQRDVKAKSTFMKLFMTSKEGAAPDDSSDARSAACTLAFCFPHWPMRARRLPACVALAAGGLPIDRSNLFSSEVTTDRGAG